MRLHFPCRATADRELGDLPGACHESGLLYPVDRAALVIVRKITAHPNRTEYFSVGIQNEHATGYGNDTALGGAGQRGVKGWRGRGPLRERAAAGAHSERAPCLAHRNIRPEDARMIMPLEGYQVASAIQHRDCHRRGIRSTRKTRHVWSNLRIARREADTLETTAIQLTIEQTDPGVPDAQVRVNDLFDTLRRDSAGIWRIVRRVISREMALRLGK